MKTIKNKTTANDTYQPYIETNTKIALNKPININGNFKKLIYPKIGIYHGPGASHSWLWFVEILDAMGFWNIEFVDEQYIINNGLDNLQVLLVSGGDTFAIAESLGKKGADKIKGFLDEGGLYIGSCAGAYLPLKSSLFPLNLFNFASVKISNLTKTLPKPITLPEKFCTSYGCNYVFHPVREEVKIRVIDSPFLKHNGELVVPIYGGPSFLPSEDVKTLAHYTGFTERTLFMTDQQLAYDTLIDKSAIVTKRMGKGQMFLLGPHLEHPHYLKANTLIADMIYQGIGELENNNYLSTPSTETSCQKNLKKLWRDIKAELSNSRIVALSLEREPVKWQIGNKVYEPEKIRVFLEAMWSRWNKINVQNCGNETGLYVIFIMAKRLTQLLRSIKNLIRLEKDTTEPAQEVFDHLKKLTASFLSFYFKERRILMMNGEIN